MEGRREVHVPEDMWLRDCDKINLCVCVCQKAALG